MSTTPYDWNVVIAGFWNRAIFTPQGIALRLFDIPEGTPIAVEVPMDGVGAYRVRHEGLSVSLQSVRLIVGSDVSDFAGLEKAMRIAARAIEWLPHTPFIAAGMNIRYRQEAIDPALAKLTEILLLAELSDIGFTVPQRTVQLSLNFEQGLINIGVQTAITGECETTLNFHRESKNKTDLLEWIKMPIAKIEQATHKLVRTMGIKLEVGA